MTANGYCVFEYLYRDAGNYKVWGELLLQGALSDADVECLRERFVGGKYFIAEQSVFRLYLKSCGKSAIPVVQILTTYGTSSVTFENRRLTTLRPCRCGGRPAIWSRRYRRSVRGMKPALRTGETRGYDGVGFPVVAARGLKTLPYQSADP